MVVNGSTINDIANGTTKHMKYILVTGGVMSEIGNEIISSSLGVLLKNNGYKVSVIKIDPHHNNNAGAFSPQEHGEVFVLDDGTEVDLDLGIYERFLNVRLTRDNNITTEKISQHVTEKERRGDYIGKTKTVQMIPHYTDAVVEWVERVAQIPVDGTNETPDVCIIELGGTVGDIEGMMYLAAFERFQKSYLKDHLMNVHVSLVIHPKATGEHKTKTMQSSIRHLRIAGLVPDLIVCQSTAPLQEHLKQKIADFGLVDLKQVIGVHDVSNIYKVPLLLQEQNVLEAIIRRLHLPDLTGDISRNLKFNMCHWTDLSELVDSFAEDVTIALIGEEGDYSYVNEALSQAAMHSERNLVITFIDSGLLETPKPGQEASCAEAWEIVKSSDGIVVPGGFDTRGVEGKIACCKYARENNVPFLGVCLGMQCAAIEYARNVLNIEGASSTEFNKNLTEEQQIIIDMPEHDMEKVGLGGTMRLGRRSTVFLTENCKLRGLYKKEQVEERHRHRYEVNPKIVPELSRQGLMFVGMAVDESGTSSALLKDLAGMDLLAKITDLCHSGGDGNTRPAVRMEMLELQGHPYFVGAQFHPEYLSQPLVPSPPFLGLLLAATGQLDGFLSGSKIPSTMLTLQEERQPIRVVVNDSNIDALGNGTATNTLTKHMKYILVTGGVISGVGKGIISSSLGVLLKNSGYKVSAIKIDPYLNIDAGTFSPYEHGEVFVLDDGGEVDLDLGNYERFLNVRLTRDNNITTGKMNQYVTERERRGDYMGKTVQMIPHFTEAIVEWVERVAQIPVDGTDETPDVCIIELGGTIGDLEGSSFVSAFERFQRPALKDHFMNVHVSLLMPSMTRKSGNYKSRNLKTSTTAIGKLKTKPMQNSIRHLRAAGLVPDLIVCRSTGPLQEHLKQKIADFGLVDLEQVIGVHDVSNIYKVPLLLQEQNVLEAIIRRLHLPNLTGDISRNLKFNMCHWTHLSELVDSFTEVVTIALVGKYTKIEDAYASVNKALSHAAIHSKRKLKIKFIDSGLLETPKPGQEASCAEAWEIVKSADGIVVPGGFDTRGVEGKIACCKYARENNVPFLGVCLGMQCAAIEYARNVLNIEGASSTEFNKNLTEEQQIIIDMPEHDMEKVGLGGTMRLGRRSTVFLTENCKLRGLYKKEQVEERHRHRYEVNPKIVPELSRQGLMFVGMGVDESNTSVFSEKPKRSWSDRFMDLFGKTSPNGPNEDLLAKITDLCHRGGDGITRPAVRMEMLELQGHPYFVGAQFHPEYLSQPLVPSPPFLGLLLAATGQLDGFLSGSKTPTPMLTLHEEESLPDMKLLTI